MILSTIWMLRWLGALSLPPSLPYSLTLCINSLVWSPPRTGVIVTWVIKYNLIFQFLAWALSLRIHRLKGRLDENRDLILYSNRPCLHAPLLPPLPANNLYPSLTLSTLSEPIITYYSPLASSYLEPCFTPWKIVSSYTWNQPRKLDLSVSLIYLATSKLSVYLLSPSY